MSFNQLMHPRNVFRKKPDYNEMANLYPEFREILLFKTPRYLPTIDYQDANSLRLLTITLLNHYFDLKVDLPINRLIPAVPQRLNYILWVEDLLSLLDLNPSDEVVGLDIGTGACCIFPLLGCSSNKNWTFLATEADDVCYEYAVKNVKNNDLTQRIKVIHVPRETFLSDIPEELKPSFDFIMCNPPFFKERFKSPSESGSMDDSNDRASCSPSASNLSSEIESVTDGGEVEFVKKIINESCQIRESVKIYTVMLGHKKSALVLRDYIKKDAPEVTSCFVNQFYQGKKIRWGLAWTYIMGLDLSQASRLVCSKSRLRIEKPLDYIVPRDLKEMHYSLQSVYRKIRIMLRDELLINDVEIIKVNKRSAEMLIKSNSNTWSHQRRKRRMEEKKSRLKNEIIGEMEVDNCLHGERSLDSTKAKEAVCSTKRKLSESEIMISNEKDLCDDEFDLKKLKGFNQPAIEKDEEVYLLYCSCVIKKTEDKIVIQMRTKATAKSKEATHQLLQYFKNHIL